MDDGGVRIIAKFIRHRRAGSLGSSIPSPESASFFISGRSKWAGRNRFLIQLGEPNARFAIASDEGTRESFTYDLASGEAVVIRLLDGKVVKVR
jgi:hypothetical protein